MIWGFSHIFGNTHITKKSPKLSGGEVTPPKIRENGHARNARLRGDLQKSDIVFT